MHEKCRTHLKGGFKVSQLFLVLFTFLGEVRVHPLDLCRVLSLNALSLLSVGLLDGPAMEQVHALIVHFPQSVQYDPGN